MYYDVLSHHRQNQVKKPVYQQHIVTHKATTVNEINQLTDQGLSSTNAMVHNFVMKLAKKHSDKNWVYHFIDSYSNVLKSDFLTGLDLSWKKANNAYQYAFYFQLICSLSLCVFCTNTLKIQAKIQEYNILLHNTYNMNEKGFLIDILQKVKRIFNKNLQKSSRLLDAEQDSSYEWITCLTTVCMNRTYISLSLIY